MHEKKEQKEMGIGKQNKHHYYCWEYLNATNKHLWAPMFLAL